MSSVACVTATLSERINMIFISLGECGFNTSDELNKELLSLLLLSLSLSLSLTLSLSSLTLSLLLYYCYYVLTDLTKHLIRDEDRNGEPSLTFTDIIFGPWQGIFRATQKAINGIARKLRKWLACRSVQKGVSYYEKGFARVFTGNTHNTLTPRACGTNFSCCAEPSVCIITVIFARVNAGSWSRRATGKP